MEGKKRGITDIFESMQKSAMAAEPITVANYCQLSLTYNQVTTSPGMRRDLFMCVLFDAYS